MPVPALAATRGGRRRSRGHRPRAPALRGDPRGGAVVRSLVDSRTGCRRGRPMIWNVPAETMPREELAALQRARLQALAGRVYTRVPFYRQAFDRAGVRPEQVRSLDDLRRLPFTRKADLRDHYPFGMFAVPREDR